MKSDRPKTTEQDAGEASEPVPTRPGRLDSLASGNDEGSPAQRTPKKTLVALEKVVMRAYLSRWSECSAADSRYRSRATNSPMPAGSPIAQAAMERTMPDPVGDRALATHRGFSSTFQFEENDSDHTET